MSVVNVRPGETVTVVGLPAIDPGLRPSHPIALPGDPWWGGGGPVDPGYHPPGIGPGQPGRPVDPGYFPPGVGGPGSRPVRPVDPGYGVDVGTGPVYPTHPIVLPPELPPTLPPPDSRPIEWKAAWTEKTGWIVVGIPTGPTPTPSA
jgi:hypothetical protein